MEGGRQQFAELQIKTVACPRFEPTQLAARFARRRLKSNFKHICVRSFIPSGSPISPTILNIPIIIKGAALNEDCASASPRAVARSATSAYSSPPRDSLRASRRRAQQAPSHSYVPCN